MIAPIAVGEFTDPDEINQYQDTRYICAPKAMHRMFEFKLHDKSHIIMRLAVHLPYQQNVYFKENELINLEALTKAKHRDTHLFEWFNLNKMTKESHTYLYTDFPYHYTWCDSNKSWKVRKRVKKPIISRMYAVSPKEIERLYLRLLFCM